MSEGFESYAAPDEGGGGGAESLSEEAKQRFAAAAQGMQQQKKEEKKAKKKDDQVAKAIIQFLDDKDHAHLFVLISRLVARDCPSEFVLAIISLINEACLQEIRNYLTDAIGKTDDEVMDASMALMKGDELDQESNEKLINWIARMQLVLSLNPEKILLKLMVDEKNIDGTVLQLTTFVLQEFLKKQDLKIEYTKAQPLTASILQTVFGPFVGMVKEKLMERAKQNTEEDD